MGKIINEKELIKIQLEITELFEGRYNKSEARFILRELSNTLEVFEKYHQGKALRETLEKVGGDLE